MVPGGVEIDVSAALAQTIEDIDINYPLEGHILVSLACKFGSRDYGKNSLFYFLSVSL